MAYSLWNWNFDLKEDSVQEMKQEGLHEGVADVQCNSELSVNESNQFQTTQVFPSAAGILQNEFQRK